MSVTTRPMAVWPSEEKRAAEYQDGHTDSIGGVQGSFDCALNLDAFLNPPDEALEIV